MKLYDLRKNKNYINEVKDSLKRHNEKLSDVKANVLDIIANVKSNGDNALKTYSEKFDKVRLDNIKVSEEEINAAYDNLDSDFLEILKESKSNIEEYHSKQHYSHFDIDTGDKRLTQKINNYVRESYVLPGSNNRLQNLYSAPTSEASKYSYSQKVRDQLDSQSGKNPKK